MPRVKAKPLRAAVEDEDDEYDEERALKAKAPPPSNKKKSGAPFHRRLITRRTRPVQRVPRRYARGGTCRDSRREAWRRGRNAYAV